MDKDTERKTTLTDAAAAVLHCRDEGHVWRHVTDAVTENRGTISEYTQVRQCATCGTTRRRSIAVPSFTITGTRYEYVDGYLFASDQRVSRTDVRREVFTRARAGADLEVSR